MKLTDDIKQSKQKSQETTKQKPNLTKLMKQIKNITHFYNAVNPLFLNASKGQIKEGWGGGE